jgi:hypothetical protein
MTDSPSMTSLLPNVDWSASVAASHCTIIVCCAKDCRALQPHDVQKGKKKPQDLPPFPSSWTYTTVRLNSFLSIQFGEDSSHITQMSSLNSSCLSGALPLRLSRHNTCNPGFYCKFSRQFVASDAFSPSVTYWITSRGLPWTLPNMQWVSVAMRQYTMVNRILGTSFN